MKAITDAHVPVYGNGRQLQQQQGRGICHILLGASAVLQQIDDEEKKEKLKKRKSSLKDCAAPSVRRISCFDEEN